MVALKVKASIQYRSPFLSCCLVMDGVCKLI